MKTKNLIITLIVLIIIGFLLVLSYQKSAGTAASIQGAAVSGSSKSLLAAAETFHDFGTISMKDGLVMKEFTVANPSTQDMLIKTLATSCMCTAAFIVEPDGTVKGPFGMAGMGYVPPADETIRAGESRTIRVVYDPNAHGPAGVGAIDRFATLTDATGGTLQFEIRALVTP